MERAQRRCFEERITSRLREFERDRLRGAERARSTGRKLIDTFRSNDEDDEANNLRSLDYSTAACQLDALRKLMSKESREIRFDLGAECAKRARLEDALTARVRALETSLENELLRSGSNGVSFSNRPDLQALRDELLADFSRTTASIEQRLLRYVDARVPRQSRAELDDFHESLICLNAEERHRSTCSSERSTGVTERSMGSAERAQSVGAIRASGWQRQFHEIRAKLGREVSARVRQELARQFSEKEVPMHVKAPDLELASSLRSELLLEMRGLMEEHRNSVASSLHAMREVSRRDKPEQKPPPDEERVASLERRVSELYVAVVEQASALESFYASLHGHLGSERVVRENATKQLQCALSRLEVRLAEKSSQHVRPQARSADRISITTPPLSCTSTISSAPLAHSSPGCPSSGSSRRARTPPPVCYAERARLADVHSVQGLRGRPCLSYAGQRLQPCVTMTSSTLEAEDVVSSLRG